MTSRSMTQSFRLADLTYPEVQAFLEAGAVGLLPYGSTEAHGPHLALRTDVIISEYAAVKAAELLRQRGHSALVLPSLSYAVTDFAAAFSGTITVSADAAETWLGEVVRSALRAGFRAVLLCTAHLDPGHLDVLQRVTEQCQSDELNVAFPNIVRRKHVARLGDEFATGACHAGKFETSLVLAAEAGAVRQDIARGLEENPSSLSVAIGEGKTSFAEAGGPEAYFGWPADASPEEGEKLYGELADIFASAAAELLSSK